MQNNRKEGDSFILLFSFFAMKGLLFVSLLTSAVARNPFGDVAQPFTDLPMPLAQPFPLDAVQLATGSRP